MKTTVMHTQVQRQRKFLLLMPAIILPFLTILFWSMKGKDGPGAKVDASLPGLNTHLPGARLKDTGAADKLSFYEQADQASRKLRQERQQDPYTRTLPDSPTLSEAAFPAGGVASPGSPGSSSARDEHEQQIYERLNKLQKVMNHEPEPPDVVSVPGTVSRAYHEPIPPQEDPDLRQMNSIMDKLVQLQQPETVKPVKSDNNAVTKQFRAIPAVIDGKQRITDHTVIRMKLTDSATINGQFFPRGQPVFAAGLFSDQRMKLDIHSIHIGRVIFPVDLTVYDAEDGLEGISVPEAVTVDALRGGAVTGVQSMELMSLDPSVSAQLATAGVNTAKGLFGKKMKRIKARLQDKRPILLRVNQLVVSPGDTTK